MSVPGPSRQFARRRDMSEARTLDGSGLALAILSLSGNQKGRTMLSFNSEMS